MGVVLILQFPLQPCSHFALRHSYVNPDVQQFPVFYLESYSTHFCVMIIYLLGFFVNPVYVTCGGVDIYGIVNHVNLFIRRITCVIKISTYV